MPYKSTLPDIDIPSTDILSYLFGHRVNSDQPVWLHSSRPEQSLSPNQALQYVKRLGFGLRERLGLQKGDVVLMFSPNHIFVPVAYLGVVGSGCIFSGANPSYTPQELGYQLLNSTAKVLLAHPDTLDRAIDAASAAGIPRNRIFQFSDETSRTRSGVRDWSVILGSAMEGQGWQWPVLNEKEASETTATINYSSGTTGLPKGVCVSHANLIANIEQAFYMRYANTPHLQSRRPPKERWLGFLPLYHAFGQAYTILLAAKFEHSVYIMKEFVFEQFLGNIARYKITTLQVAPPVVVMLCKRPETAQYDISSVKDIKCGAAPLSREVQGEFEAKFGIPIQQGWGMTELTCAGASFLHYLGGITGSVGLILPNTYCKLLNDRGLESGGDEPGELHIKGPNVCLGYWRNEAATNETIRDGWLKTGDVAIRNSDGYLWIVDRKKELIKVNGLQVAPAELEAALLQNKHVADAAVVGINLGGNEWPRAYVVLQDQAKSNVDETEVRDWVDKRVSKHKRLVGGVMFVPEIPKLASGKIQRKVMREWAERDAMKELTNDKITTMSKL